MLSLLEYTRFVEQCRLWNSYGKFYELRDIWHCLWIYFKEKQPKRISISKQWIEYRNEQWWPVIWEFVDEQKKKPKAECVRYKCQLVLLHTIPYWNHHCVQHFFIVSIHFINFLCLLINIRRFSWSEASCILRRQSIWSLEWCTVNRLTHHAETWFSLSSIW